MHLTSHNPFHPKGTTTVSENDNGPEPEEKYERIWDRIGRPFKGWKNRLVVNNGPCFISMCSDENGPFIINQGGKSTVRLLKSEINIDLNNDGIKPDYFIQLSHVKKRLD